MFLNTIEAKIVCGDVTGLFTSRSPSLSTVRKPQLQQVFPEPSWEAATLLFSSLDARERQMKKAAQIFETGEELFVSVEGRQRSVTAFRPLNSRELVVILQSNE